MRVEPVQIVPIDKRQNPIQDEREVRECSSSLSPGTYPSTVRPHPAIRGGCRLRVVATRCWVGYGERVSMLSITSQ